MNTVQVSVHVTLISCLFETVTMKCHNTGNFFLLPQGGPCYIIQRINNPNQRLHAENTTAIRQEDIPTTSGDTIWVAESTTNSSQLGLKFYTTTGAQRWYLRADGFSGSVDLVRSDHVSSIVDPPRYLFASY